MTMKNIEFHLICSHYYDNMSKSYCTLFFTINRMLTCIRFVITVVVYSTQTLRISQTHKFMYNIPCSSHVLFSCIVTFIHSFFRLSVTVCIVEKKKTVDAFTFAHLALERERQSIFFSFHLFESRIDIIAYVWCTLFTEHNHRIYYSGKESNNNTYIQHKKTKSTEIYLSCVTLNVLIFILYGLCCL